MAQIFLWIIVAIFSSIDGPVADKQITILFRYGDFVKGFLKTGDAQMRTAGDIVEDYRKRGYTDERLKALAGTRPEPLRSEILAILEAEEGLAGGGDMSGQPVDIQNDLFLSVEEEGVAEIADLPPEVAIVDEAPAEMLMVETEGAVEKTPGGLFHEEISSVIEEIISTAEEDCSCEDEAKILDEIESDMNKETTITLVIEENIEINLECSGSGSDIPEILMGTGVELTDIRESEELIKEAYRRAGIYDVQEPVGEESAEDDYSGYVAPDLTLINCEEYEETEGNVIPVAPSYALSPEEREKALQRAEEYSFLMIANMLNANFEEYRREHGDEELLIPCDDFDSIARPAEDDYSPVAVFAEVEADVEADVEAGEKIAALASELEMKQIVIAELENELDCNKRAVSAMRSQIERESNEVARLSGLSKRELQEVAELKGEVGRLYRDIDRLCSQLDNANQAVLSQSEMIMQFKEASVSLNASVNDLFDDKKHLEQLLHSRELDNKEAAGRVGVLEEEIYSLREKFQQQNDKISELTEERDRLVESGKDITALERDYNILKLETVPNLQRDKEELVEMISEEHDRCVNFEAVASRRSRRLSYTMTVAAAACVLVVLTPILSWSNHKTELLEKEAAYASRLAQAENIQDAIKAERDDLKARFEAVKLDFTQAQDSWNRQLTVLRQCGTTGTSANNSAQVPVKYDNRMFDFPATNREVAETDSDGHNDQTHYNNVRMVTPAVGNPQVAANSEENDKFKNITVKRGEGMSHVLWRVYKNSSPEMVEYITRINNLKTDKKGNPVLMMGQIIKLPLNPKTAMLQ